MLLGGQERELKFGFKAIIALEEHYNEKNMNKIFAQHIGESLSGLAVMFWAGLRHENKKLTVDKVIDWLEEAVESGDYTLQDLSEQLRTNMEKSKLIGKGASEGEEKN